MKKLLLMACLIATQAKGQFAATGKTDTVQCYFLTSYKTVNCTPSCTQGWIVRNEMRYFGDPMPPGNYDTYYEAAEIYLDYYKKPIPANVIVWQFKIKEK